MHQTVRRFFLRLTGSAHAFTMNSDDAHIRISVVCIRYLLLCANCKLGKKFPDIESWNSEHLEAYAHYISERPLISYTLCHLKNHMHFCLQEVSISDLVIQIIEKLADNPASYLLESWITSQLKMTSPEVPSGTAQRLHTSDNTPHHLLVLPRPLSSNQFYYRQKTFASVFSCFLRNQLPRSQNESLRSQKDIHLPKGKGKNG